VSRASGPGRVTDSKRLWGTVPAVGDQADRTDQPMAVGTFSPSVLLRVARRSGLLEAAGIAVTELPVASSPAQFTALLDGELDAAVTSPDNVLAYRYVPANPLGRTADLRIVAAVDRGLGLGVYARAGIREAADLAGARVGVDVPTSGFAFALYAVLAAAGLDRDDYAVVPLGSTPRRLEALLAGDCDATMLGAGNDLRAEDAGLPLLGRVVDVARPYLGTVLAVTAGADDARTAALAGSLRAAAAAVLDGSAREVAVAEAADAMGLPPALAERYVDRMSDPDEGLIGDGEVDRASLATVLELRRRYLPAVVGGVDLLAGALDDPGLVVPAGR
jgi:ABC-type nitrate/sulfonate/bicarbonate transport system substrate-binding protein